MSSEADNRASAPGEQEARMVKSGQRKLLVEGAFSRVLGATMAGPFLTATVLAFGGLEAQVGLAVAAGRIGSIGMLLANPVLSYLGSRRKFCLFGLGGVRVFRVVVTVMLALVLLGWDAEGMFWPFLAVVFISHLLGMSSEISRRSWISDLVGPAERGRYLGLRLTITLLVGGAFLLAGGYLLTLSESIPPWNDRVLGLTIIMGFGAAMGWIGWSILVTTPEPSMSIPRRGGLLRSLWLPLRSPRYRGLMLVGTLFHMAMGLCAAFFDYYMFEDLGMEPVWVMAVDTVGMVVAAAGASRWGAWADRVGTRRVLTLTVVVKGLYPLTWLLVTPTAWPVAFIAVLPRVFNSASILCWLRLSMNCSPRRNQPAFLAMSQAALGVGVAVGALIGGLLARQLRLMEFSPVLLGFQVLPLHVVFVISAVLRLSCLPLLRLIREPRRHYGGQSE
jgi:hypothetical protein